MFRYCYWLVLALSLGCSSSENRQQETIKNDMPQESTPQISIVEYPEEQKVDVLIDEKLFTSYIFPTDLEKPVLFPLISAHGDTLTRSFPRHMRAGERVDHPHHVGIWFNYGDVNGLDFWNNSYRIPEDRKAHYGTIRHRAIKHIEQGEVASLEVSMDWLAPNEAKLLQEETTFTFRAHGNTRIIDRVTTLVAQQDTVHFHDNKEGMLAVRVARFLEMPTQKPIILTDAQGNQSDIKVLDNTGVQGNYLSSEGKMGEDVWGKRAVWVKLQSVLHGEEVAIAIVDHPKNPGYPTYWHARPYGLFAANPLGQQVFSSGKETFMFKLRPAEEVTFRYRVIVHSGSELSPEQIEEYTHQFADF